jgi:hypothetical protein
LHHVVDLFELNVKLQCQKLKLSQLLQQASSINTITCVIIMVPEKTETCSNVIDVSNKECYDG